MSDSVRVYPAYMRGTKEELITIELEFGKMWAALKCSRTDAINEIFLAGMKALPEREDLADKVDNKAISVYLKWREVVAGESTQTMLEQIYEAMELEEFREFCDHNSIDHERFLKAYMMNPPTTQAKSKTMESWLNYILGDGEEYEASDVRSAAEIEQVVHNDSDWNLMKNVASRMGYSSGGRRGYWCKR
jgi:hypothetical protein